MPRNRVFAWIMLATFAAGIAFGIGTEHMLGLTGTGSVSREVVAPWAILACTGVITFLLSVVLGIRRLVGH